MPTTSPVMVVERVLVTLASLWMKATRVPFGVAPLSAKTFGGAPAGFCPTRFVGLPVQPVMGVLTLMVPGEVVCLSTG